MHGRVCLESATAEPEPSWRPVRRCAFDRTGIAAKVLGDVITALHTLAPLQVEDD